MTSLSPVKQQQQRTHRLSIHFEKNSVTIQHIQSISINNYRETVAGTASTLSSNISGYFRYSPTCNDPNAASANPVDKVNVAGLPKPKDKNAMLNK